MRRPGTGQMHCDQAKRAVPLFHQVGNRWSGWLPADASSRSWPGGHVAWICIANERLRHTLAAPRWRGICPGGTVAKLCERISVKLLDAMAVYDTVGLARRNGQAARAGPIDRRPQGARYGPRLWPWMVPDHGWAGCRYSYALPFRGWPVTRPGQVGKGNDNEQCHP
jgi:hypothetical protein